MEYSYKKHNISPSEAEEVFIDRYVIKYEDKEHSVKEERFIAIGKTKKGRFLFIVYTMREEKMRSSLRRESVISRISRFSNKFFTRV